MTTESRSPRSRCRGCRKHTELRARHRRILRRRRSCRYLSIVPLWESGCAECGCVVEEEEVAEAEEVACTCCAGRSPCSPYRACTRQWRSLPHRPHRCRSTRNMCHQRKAETGRMYPNK